MQKLPGDPLGFESAKRAAEKGTQFAKEQIEKHKKDIDYDSPPRDYIDAYLIKMREEEHSFNKEISDKSTAPSLEMV